MPGFFIVVEGIDGAGKSTLCGNLKIELEKQGYEVVLTYEPTDGRFGKELKKRIREGNITPEEELKLFFYDRSEHVEKIIKPSLNSGKIVISDRYYLSTCAYQGARGLDYRKICEDNSIFPSPDFVILLDIEPSESLKRKERIEEHFEELDFLKKVREIYLRIIDSFPHIIINANLSPEEVLLKAKENLEKCLKK